MKVIFLDTNNTLSSSHYINASKLDVIIQGPDGRSYQFLENKEKSYSPMRRMGIGIQAFAKTLFSLVRFSLLPDQVKESWKAAIFGKKLIKIYVPLDENHQTEKTTQVSLQTLPNGSNTPEDQQNQINPSKMPSTKTQVEPSIDKEVVYNNINNKIHELKLKNYSPDVWNDFMNFIKKISTDKTIPLNQFNQLNLFAKDEVLQTEDLKNFIVYFAGSSPRVSEIQTFCLKQASSCMHQLMQREDKLELIKEIKSELIQQHKTFEPPRNYITPYTCFWLNLKDLADFPEKTKFMQIYENTQVS